MFPAAIYFNSDLSPRLKRIVSDCQPLSITGSLILYIYTTKGFHHCLLFANQLLEYMCEAIREALSHIIRLIVKSQY